MEEKTAPERVRSGLLFRGGGRGRVPALFLYFRGETRQHPRPVSKTWFSSAATAVFVRVENHRRSLRL